jgi:hypothetical protein
MQDETASTYTISSWHRISDAHVFADRCNIARSGPLAQDVVATTCIWVVITVAPVDPGDTLSSALRSGSVKFGALTTSALVAKLNCQRSVVFGIYLP